jgi:hypothetical protein
MYVLNNIQTIPVILLSKVDHSPANKDQDFIEKRGEAKGFMLWLFSWSIVH